MQNRYINKFIVHLYGALTILRRRDFQPAQFHAACAEHKVALIAFQQRCIIDRYKRFSGIYYMETPAVGTFQHR